MKAIRKTTSLTLFAAAASAAVLSGHAESAPSSTEATIITLPAFQKTGGMPLMEAIAQRRSSREFAPDSLTGELLGGVLWATAGYNRPEEKKRVAASTRNWQAIEVYAMLETGVYAYDAERHALNLLVAGDHRKLAGPQPFAVTAPLNLIYIGDTAKMEVPDMLRQMLYLGADAGLMAQNAYLYAASEGLACVLRGSIEHDSLAKLLNLPKHKQVLFGQTIGHPAK